MNNYRVYMISRDDIENLKNDPTRLVKVLSSSSDNGDISRILEHLGFLPKEFNFEIFTPLTVHKITNVRFWAVKNLGKKSDATYFQVLTHIAETDPDSKVRREAVSSIGRMRNEISIPFLLKTLDDKDPKVVLQAIRGLLVFKNREDVSKELKSKVSHPNEIVQSVIKKEYYSKKNKNISTIPHPCSPEFLQNVVVLGDVLEILTKVPDESIHLTFTSPPYYNARDYSIYESYEEYLTFLENVFIEVNRITKEGRFFILNTSPIIIPRVSRAHSSTRYPIPFDIHARLVKNGWEFIDDIVWLKPETSVKNRNAGFLQHRKPLGYKPNSVTEYLMVYRKQTDKLLDWNMHQYDQKTIEVSKVVGSYETSNVWKIDPVFDKVHSAVFPIELCNRVIKFYSYKRDLVFDPFGGSGTFAKAALALNRLFFLTEKDEKYFSRIKENLASFDTFSDKKIRYLTTDQLMYQ